MFANAFRNIFDSRPVSKKEAKSKDVEVPEEGGEEDNNHGTSENGPVAQEEAVGGVDEVGKVEEAEGEEQQKEEDIGNQKEPTSTHSTQIQPILKTKGGEGWTIVYRKAIDKSKETHSLQWTNPNANANTNKPTLVQRHVSYATPTHRYAVLHNRQIVERRMANEHNHALQREFQRVVTNQKLYEAQVKRTNQYEALRERLQKQNNKIKTLTNTLEPQRDATETLAHTIQQQGQEATRARETYLRAKQQKAANEVNYARSVAMEKRQFDREYGSIRKRVLNERLKRAELKRTIDRESKRYALQKRLAYVAAVTDRNTYMQLKSDELLSQQLEAADYRRQLKLREIQSKAKYHNINVQTKVAYVQTVHHKTALQTFIQTEDRLQNAATVRRQFHKQSAQQRGQKSVREKVYDQQTVRETAIAKIASQTKERLRQATERREKQTELLQALKQDKKAYLQARKTTNATMKTRALGKAVQAKLNDAEYRRQSLLERRRRKCANNHWKGKMKVQTWGTRNAEIAEQRKVECRMKLEAAEERRALNQRPVFALRHSYRVLCVQQALQKQEDEAMKVKQARQTVGTVGETNDCLVKIRQAIQWESKLKKGILQVTDPTMEKGYEPSMEFLEKAMNGNSIGNANANAKENLTVRLLSAEIRRTLLSDAKAAFARKDAAIGHEVRRKKELSTAYARLCSNQKLREAEERRQIIRSHRLLISQQKHAKVNALKQLKQQKQQKQKSEPKGESLCLQPTEATIYAALQRRKRSLRAKKSTAKVQIQRVLEKAKGKALRHEKQWMEQRKETALQVQKEAERKVLLKAMALSSSTIEMNNLQHLQILGKGIQKGDIASAV